MDGLEFFPDIDLGTRRGSGDSCAKPIGPHAAVRRRCAGPTSRRSPIAHQVAELRRHLDTRLDQVMGELQALRQQRRNAFEMPEGILRRLVEIERHLRLVETPAAPRISRRRPLQ